MIKYFGKAFRITNENIILTTPLVLFLFLLSIYLGVAQNAPPTIASAILLLVTILFMLSAFFAGWFFMVKKAIDLDKREFIIEEDKAKASFGLIKEVTAGIGEYFIPFIGAFILYSGLLILLVFISYQLGMHFIGKVGVSLIQIKTALESTVAMKSLVSTLTKDELIKLNAWNFLTMGMMAIYSFITMFWAAQIVSKTKNPLVAFFQSINFTLKHFFPSLIIFIYISLINFTVSLLNAFAMINPILYFISMLVYFYFVVYVVVLVFLYYDRENKTENNCSSGSDSLGENEVGDSDSSED